MVYTLLQATGEGHVYLPKDELFQRAAELLGVDSSYMEKHLVDLAIDRKIVHKEQGDQILIYPAQYYYLDNSSFHYFLIFRAENIKFPKHSCRI